MSRANYINAFLVCFLIFFAMLVVQGGDEQGSEKLFKEEDGDFSLLAEVSTVESFVRLKHLTERVFTNSAYKEMLICKRPLKDKPITLTKEYLTKLFKSNGMDDKTLFLMDIPAEVKISYGEMSSDAAETKLTSIVNGKQVSAKKESLTEIDSSEILLRVSNVIDHQLRKYDPQISIYQSQGSSNWKVKVPEDYDLKILPGMIIKANSVMVKVGVYHKNVMVDAKMFNFKADIYIKTFAADVNLDKGKIINKDDFSMQLVPYSIDALNYIREEKSLIGFETQKSIKAGEGLESKDVNTPLLISRGASVNIVVKNNGFSIRAVGIAQESGRLGDQISVLIRSTDSKIKCNVIGENTVDIIQ